MSSSAGSGHQPSQSRAIPTRTVPISDAAQLPHDYCTTPGGTLFSTTPGGNVSTKSILAQGSRFTLISSHQGMKKIYQDMMPLVAWEDQERRNGQQQFFLTVYQVKCILELLHDVLVALTGTRIIYDRKFLLDRRNSPMAQTPPCHLPNIPGVTSPGTLIEDSKVEVNNLNNLNNHDRKHAVGDDAQFEMDI